MADVLYFSGPAEHSHVGWIDSGEGMLPARYVAMWFPALILDCCKVGQILEAEGKTRVLAAAEEYAFEGDKEKGSIFGHWLERWIREKGQCDVSSPLMLGYLSASVMQATGIQKVCWGWL
jgi:hypothetical protein